jgi:hypothetical protein
MFLGRQQEGELWLGNRHISCFLFARSYQRRCMSWFSRKGETTTLCKACFFVGYLTTLSVSRPGNRMMDKWFWKKLEKSGRSLIQVPSLYSPWGTEKTHVNPESWKPISRRINFFCELLYDTGNSETVQVAPGGKINIPRGHNVGHSKRKYVHVHVSYS